MKSDTPSTPDALPADAEIKLTPRDHVMCGWPLVLVAVGGAVGGGLGGLAYGINVWVYKSKLPTAVKIVLNPLIGLAAIAGWLAIAAAFHSARQN
jgi:hypothetical protein